MNGRRYWRSQDELADTPEFKDWLHREFPSGASELEDGQSRRNFLKLMSASFALATAGGISLPSSKVTIARGSSARTPSRRLMCSPFVSFS